MHVPLSEEHRIMLLNGAILILIVLLIWAMPKEFVEPDPIAEEPDEPDPQLVARDTQSGQDALLVLLSEYNFDYEPRMRAAATSGVGVCEAFPFLEMPACPQPQNELAFVLTNTTMNGWLGYAVFTQDQAEALIARLSLIEAAADGGYVSVERTLDRITDYELVSEPDEALVFFHPTATRFEHGWIARFGSLIIYGYEHTQERRITRKFTHAFDEELRSRVIDSYDLSYTDHGVR